MRRISQCVLWTLVRILWKPRVAGFENLPRSGPVIIAANHVSLFDGPLLIVIASTVRYTCGLAKAELYRIPVLGWYLGKTGILPLERKGDVVTTMRAAADLLKRGGCLALFPEGTRSKTGAPLRPKGGVAFLAGHGGATVVPARLLHTEKFLSFHPFELRFGPGLKFEGDVEDRQQRLGFAQKVMDRVFSL